MAASRRTKVNRLVSQWPKGAVITQAYLTQIGYNADLVKSYKKSQWIEPVVTGSGAYKLFDDQVEWYGGLYALQKQLQIHAGGKTALELKGFGHYTQHVESSCFLFSVSRERLPKWFAEYDWGAKIIYKETNLLPPKLQESFSQYQHRDFSITISAPERAALEMLYYVPAQQGFDEAYKIMESLVTLRPAIVQTLLRQCRSVKVKRLFLYMADKLEHPWFSRLNLEKIDLGKGKRVVVEHGTLDKKYQITVLKDSPFEKQPVF